LDKPQEELACPPCASAFLCSCARRGLEICMDNATLDDFMALNDQLAALIKAGVPLELGLVKSGEDSTTALEKINAAIARRVSRGQSLVEALESEERTLPTAYRSLVQIGLKSGDLRAGLEAASRLARSADQSKYNVRSAFFYPLVVCCLAAIGFAGYCTFVVPKLESAQEGLRIPEGEGLRWLQWLGAALPAGLIVLALVVIAGLTWRFVASGRNESATVRGDGLIARLVGTARAGYLERCAIFANSLATLLAANVPVDIGLRLAADASGDRGLREGAQKLAANLQQGQATTDGDPAAKAFPPFMRWALLGAEPAVNRTRALEMAADVYRQSAARRSERVRVVAPILTCVLLGGSAVLLYGLALFVPVVELLESLALQR
jgi:type II secretory pathway component PulF